MFCISVPVKSNVATLAGALASLRVQDAPCAVALLDASGAAAVPAIADASGLAFAYRRHGPDAGQAAAITEGWLQAPGDILGWLNDDDLLLPGALDAVAAILAAEPATEIVYGHGVMLDADGGFTGYFPSIADDPAALRCSNIICQPAAFVRRAAVERIGGLDTALHFTMDWDLWLRLYEAGARFRFVDRPLAAVRSHATTKTRSGGPARRREIARLMAPRLSRRGMLRLRLGLALSNARDNGRRLEAAVLATLFAVARAGRAPNAPAHAVLGIDPVGNRVAHACTVLMPAGGDGSTVDLRVETDRAVTLTAHADGVPRPVRRVDSGKGFACRVEGVPVRRGAVRCELAAADGAWRLRRVSVAAPAAPDR
jgi:GT2 family glycosyltransferase